jgi:cell division protein FtsL
VTAKTDHREPLALVFACAAFCVVTAVALVYTKHESRKLFVELETLTDERDELNIEWGQLQIEQSTWATHARIEQVATDELKLSRPEATDIFVIEEQ